MSVKKNSLKVEKEYCNRLGANGYWAAVFPPDSNGAQPCDVVASKQNIIYLIDVKDCHSPKFPLSRIEDNQLFSMQKLVKTSENAQCYFALKYKDKWHKLDFRYLDLTQKSIDIESLEEI